MRQLMESERPTLVAMLSGSFSRGGLEGLITTAKLVRW